MDRGFHRAGGFGLRCRVSPALHLRPGGGRTVPGPMGRRSMDRRPDGSPGRWGQGGWAPRVRTVGFGPGGAPASGLPARFRAPGAVRVEQPLQILPDMRRHARCPAHVLLLLSTRLTRRAHGRDRQLCAGPCRRAEGDGQEQQDPAGPGASSEASACALAEGAVDQPDAALRRVAPLPAGGIRRRGGGAVGGPYPGGQHAHGSVEARPTIKSRATSGSRKRRTRRAPASQAREKLSGNDAPQGPRPPMGAGDRADLGFLLPEAVRPAARAYADWLLSCDRIALDCYQAAYTGIGKARSIPAPPRFATCARDLRRPRFAAAIPLRRLGRWRSAQSVPARCSLPYHRLVNPWTLGAMLRTRRTHNLQKRS